MTTPTSKHDTVNEQRRTVLLGTGAMAALGTVGAAFAEEPDHSAHKTKATSLITAVEECEEIGEACLAHTYGTFIEGDTSLALCAVLVSDAIAICDTTGKLALNNSSHLEHIAPVCMGVCDDCKKECVKHQEKHPICKDMADACQAVVDECKKLIG